MIAGTYVFRYTVTGGCNPGSKDVTVTVAGGSAVTTAIASPDQHYCSMPSSTSINANASATGETGTWTQIAGPSATITSPNSPSTTVTGLTSAGGTYSFLYTISNGTCLSYDTVSIHQIPQLLFTTNNYNQCNNSILAQHEEVKTGNYYYGQIPYMDVTMTVISAPSGGWASPVFRKGSSGATPINPQNINLYQGQSYSLHITGDSLYHYSSPSQKYFQTYFMDFGIWGTSLVAGTYMVKFTISTPCQTFEYLTTRTRGITGSAVNAGTDIKVACGATATNLIGNLANGHGFWTTVSMPTGATNPINSTNQALASPSISGLENGTYVFRYSPNPGPACTPTTFDEVKVVVSNTVPPTPDAGADMTVCGGTATLNGSAVTAGTLAQWSLVTPTGGAVSFSNHTGASTQVSGLLPSTIYTFVYKLENGCGVATDTVQLTTNSATAPAKPAISYGNDCSNIGLTAFQTTYNNIVVQHPALAAGLDSSWTIIFNPAGPTATASPQTPTSTRINISNITTSTLVSIIYTLSNSSCPGQSTADTLTYLIRKPDFTWSAGPAQRICNATSFPTTVTLTGMNTSLPVLWSSVNTTASGAPQILSPNSPTTQVVLPGPGVYSFSYVLNNTQDVTCGTFFNRATTQVVVSTPGSIASAGDDIAFCNATGTTNLAAVPIAVGTGTWEVYDVVYGTAPSIANTNDPNSAITFNGAGQVVLKWNSYGSVPECGPSSSDLVTVTYYAPANAGNDQQFCQRTSTTLYAMNPAPGSGLWTQISGPTTATIVNDTAHQTAATNLAAGTYTFRWTVTTANAACNTFDDVVLVNNEMPIAAAAGPDQFACNGDNITLAATAVPTGYTGTWTLVQYPAGATLGTFSNVNDPGATYTSLTAQGTYTFAWTVTDGTACESRDYVVVDATAQGCSIALPVTLKSFRAITKDCSIELLWDSEKEDDFAGYELQRSKDGRDYETIAAIAPKGNQSQYTYLDHSAAGKTVFYRLKMIDLNGKHSFSNIIALELDCQSTNMVVYPNPSKGQDVTVTITTNVAIPYGYLKLVNSADVQMFDYPVVLNEGSNSIRIPLQQVAAGTYSLQLIDENGKPIAVQKIVVH